MSIKDLVMKINNLRREQDSLIIEYNKTIQELWEALPKIKDSPDLQPQKLCRRDTMEPMTDFEYALWCMLNELDRLAIPDELRLAIYKAIKENITEEKVKGRHV